MGNNDEVECILDDAVHNDQAESGAGQAEV